MTFAGAVLAGSVVSGTTLVYPTLGELVGERAGIVNLGLEGTMLIGAAVGFGFAAVTGNAYLGLLAAAAAGMLTTLLLGALVILRRANQLAAGLSLLFFGLGASTLIGRPFVGAYVAALPSIAVGGLGRFDILVWLSVPAALLIWALLFRTSWGLGLRAVGENPSVAFAAGWRPARLQFQALALGGLLGGIGGAHLSLAVALSWDEGMTAGRGFIAIALVIFARWNPLWAIPGALVFGGAEALQLQMQASGFDVSPFLMTMVPYVLTLVVMVVWGVTGRVQAPAALGRSFVGVE